MLRASPTATESAVSPHVPAALSVARLREVLSGYYQRSTLLAVLLLLLDAALFAAGQWLVLAGSSAGAEFIGFALTTLAIVRLFIIGHDACHGSLTDHAALNKLLGRIAFLPSLTPYSLWRVGHNVVHHGFNNLKGRDFVWSRSTRPSSWPCRRRDASSSASTAAGSVRCPTTCSRSGGVVCISRAGATRRDAGPSSSATRRWCRCSRSPGRAGSC
jgi:fatty acid desaturase